MITELTLRNFKAFGDTPQRLPIKPLTLIFGANSSGKSSIIQSLLLLHHGESGSQFRVIAPAGFGAGGWRPFSSWELSLAQLDVYQPKLGGTLIDLGGFRNYVHRRNSEALVALGIEFSLQNPEMLEEIGNVEDAEILLKDFKSLGVNLHIGLKPCRESYQWPGHRSDEEGGGWATRLVGEHLSADKVHVQRLEILLDGIQLVCFERTRDEAMELCPVNRNHPWVAMVVAKQDQDERATGAYFDVFDPENAKSWQAIGGMFPELLQGKSLSPFDGNLRGSVGNLSLLCMVLRRVAARVFSKLDYLGGLRTLPPRWIAPTAMNEANRYAAGIGDWESLCRDADLVTAVNRWLAAPERLATRYKLRVRTLIDSSRAAEEIGTAASRGNREGNLDQAIHATIHRLAADGFLELVLMDQATGTTVSHRDVGLGISQILPVLVRAYGSEKQLHCIEQPEIHLHPALQAELGDVFIESALGERKNTFLLETHSEHLILRILRRVRETTAGTLPPGMPPVRPEDVSVVYVQPGPNGSEIIELPVTPDGDFDRPWPGGFFAERFQDLP